MIFAVLFVTTTYGQPVARQLPAPIVESLCVKYKGVPAFIRGGAVIRIDCAYVATLARIDAPTLVENYRQIFADAAGQLTGVATLLNFNTIYRATLDQAVSRGSISKFFDAYVDLQTDLQIAKLRYTAAANDRVVDRDGTISVVVSAQ